MFHNWNASHYVRNCAHPTYLFWTRLTHLLQEGQIWGATLDEPFVCILEIIYFRLILLIISDLLQSDLKNSVL